MPIHRILIVAGAGLTALAVAISAAPAQENSEETQAPETEEAAQETFEQKTARELCTETAAPGVHKDWSIVENRTCQNSFAETCVAVRKADGARFSHACYAALPPLPPLPGEDAGDDAAETEE